MTPEAREAVAAELMTERFRHWRWRFVSWRWHHAPFRLTATVVWPDEKPILPSSRGVKAHSYYYRFWMPWAAWRAASEWEAERFQTPTGDR